MTLLLAEVVSVSSYIVNSYEIAQYDELQEVIPHYWTFVDVLKLRCKKATMFKLKIMIHKTTCLIPTQGLELENNNKNLFKTEWGCKSLNKKAC